MSAAYLTADQLDRYGPEACTPRPASPWYVRNDDGSNAMWCADAGRRIDPTTGQCGYCGDDRMERVPLLTRRHDGAPVMVLCPAPAYPNLSGGAS